MGDNPTATWAPLAAGLAQSNKFDPEAFSRAAKTGADIAKSQIENEQQAWLNKQTRAAADVYHAISNDDGSINDQKASEYMAKNPELSGFVLGMRGQVQGQAEKAANIARTQVETATGAAKLPAIQARAGYEAQTIQGLPSAFQQASPFQSGFSKLSPADKQAASRFAGASGAAAGGDVGKSLEGMENAKEAQIRAKAQQDFLSGDTGAIQRGEADIQALRSGGFMKEALEGGRQVTSTDIAQEGGKLGIVKSGQDISAFKSAETARQHAATRLGLEPDDLGPSGDMNAAKVGQRLIGRGGSYRALVAQARGMADDIKSLIDPRNATRLGQESASLTRLVNTIAEGSTAGHEMNRSLAEAGIPPTFLNAEDKVGFLKTWIAQNPAQSADALRKLPDILFNNVIAPDYEAVGGNSTTWKRKLDKEAGLPSVGDEKTFPNGKKGRWDGKGWEAVK